MLKSAWPRQVPGADARTWPSRHGSCNRIHAVHAILAVLQNADFSQFAIPGPHCHFDNLLWHNSFFDWHSYCHMIGRPVGSDGCLTTWVRVGCPEKIQEIFSYSNSFSGWHEK